MMPNCLFKNNSKFNKSIQYGEKESNILRVLPKNTALVYTEFFLENDFSSFC